MGLSKQNKPPLYEWLHIGSQQPEIVTCRNTSGLLSIDQKEQNPLLDAAKGFRRLEWCHCGHAMRPNVKQCIRYAGRWEGLNAADGKSPGMANTLMLD